MINKHSILGAIRAAFAACGLPLTNCEKRLIALRDSCAGRRIFIIGNGPSLKTTDVSLLKNEITIGCNALFLLFEEMGFIPTFYTCEDPLVAEDRADSLNALSGTTKVFPHDVGRWLRQDEDTVFVNFPRRYPGFPRFCGNLVRRAYFGGTVTYLNLQLAWYLGSREVYLVGIDHNYAPPKEEDQIDGSRITSQTEDVNHFHPDYFGPGFRWHDPKVDRMEQAYIEARKFYEANGGTIKNATLGGKLEVFERADYNGLFTV